MIALKWSFRVLAALAAVAPATRAEAQQVQPQVGGGFRPQPNAGQKAPAVIVHPQINTMPGIPASVVYPPSFNPGPFFNPALNNPWLNQTQFVPYNPFVLNPFNPLFAPNNPFVNNPFAPNPFVPNAFNNPFAINPFNNPFRPFATSTPPIAIQQPGQLMWRGPDLQVNPISGTVYRPLSGIARTADGNTFFRVPGSGLPTFTGAYAPGTGLYFNPAQNTFLNPASGVISRPGVTTVFLPWIPG
ncbi:hypothetical protein J8F10_15205 [Gemmata sp. G18]|uniref:Uncharacterized protein n=1 Tax=Gemmata palustris TaxID=2822762 RepID=A0ABS5BSB7_9BACT|nr:hypothetical protein [Gemmata palustris]MBP3956620.1 hypothetical protein [Gemmata palustris]